MVKKLPSGWRERLRKKPCYKVVERGLSKATQIQRLLAVPLVDFSLGDQLTCQDQSDGCSSSSCVPPPRLGSGSPASYRDEVCEGRIQGTQIQKGLVHIFLQGHGSFFGIQAGTPLIWGYPLPVLKEGTVTVLVLHLQETLSVLAFLLCHFTEEVAYVLYGHVVTFSIEAQRVVDTRDLQIQSDLEVDGSIHISGIILMNLGADG